MKIKKMIPYGKFKGGSGKIHSHNKCDVCSFSDENVNPKRERQQAKKEIQYEMERYININRN
jgi:hypothetical protein